MIELAPGAPGIPPTWTSSAKDMVGCGLGQSRLWFTLGFGIVNEIYYPRVDIPQIRDLGFIVADDAGFWAEVKRVDDYQLRLLSPGVPAVEIRHRHPRFSLMLRISPGSQRDILAIECRLDGDDRLKLYVLLAPHLGATGYGNTAAVVANHDRIALCAEQGPFGVALAAVDERQRDAIGRASAGYVGFSDGWQDFARHGRMTWQYRRRTLFRVALLREPDPGHAIPGRADHDLADLLQQLTRGAARTRAWFERLIADDTAGAVTSSNFWRPGSRGSFMDAIVPCFRHWPLPVLDVRRACSRPTARCPRKPPGNRTAPSGRSIRRTGCRSGDA